ncbi:YifB family Mg chelatase-like AAA ATPase [Agrococcus versicolor]|uniref:YifB family Mg chelatase-like AAA ATPase n=1 Tax=Agrococcus versicolor TaxID=501482 RepID=A0ABN3AN51_9MICO
MSDVRIVGVARTIALQGLAGRRVDVEVDVASGLPSVRVVGMPDAAIREAQHRTQSAIETSGFEFPATRVLVNLTPASLPKAGSHLDLPMAIAVLRATGVVPAGREAALFGELGLDGRLQPLRGVLPLVRAAALDGADEVLVPHANADEASLVEGVHVRAVASLREAAIVLGADVESVPVEPATLRVPVAEPRSVPDLVDVIGNLHAVEALQVAAAGAHHMLMLGPPGAGKTMLASRLPGLLPQLDVDQALDVASMRSLSGIACQHLDRTPPFEAPHHSATAGSLVGGGGALIRPGAISRASHGVLFLDECPEFSRVVLDGLREPLESGVIEIHRAAATAAFPAAFQLVLAANPCPCGHHGTGRCRCAPTQRRRYLGRLSGPLLDRVDLQVTVDRVRPVEAASRADEPRITTAVARERVAAARERAAHRLRDTPWRAMGHVDGPWLRRRHPLPPDVAAPLDEALARGAISMRGYDRTLRVACTVADLDDAPVRREHVGRALFYRQGIPA